jgi:hypothetical protein
MNLASYSEISLSLLSGARSSERSVSARELPQGLIASLSIFRQPRKGISQRDALTGVQQSSLYEWEQSVRPIYDTRH